MLSTAFSIRAFLAVAVFGTRSSSLIMLSFPALRPFLRGKKKGLVLSPQSCVMGSSAPCTYSLQVCFARSVAFPRRCSSNGQGLLSTSSSRGFRWENMIFPTEVLNHFLPESLRRTSKLNHLGEFTGTPRLRASAPRSEVCVRRALAG